MNVIKFVIVLYKMNVLSPIGLWHLLAAIWLDGINVMLLLRLAARFRGQNIAFVDDDETIRYEQLFSRSKQLAHLFSEKYHIKKGQKIGFLCSNHASFVTALFAASRLGADLYLLNPKMSKEQFHQFAGRHKVDFLVYDAQWHSVIERSSYAADKLLSYHDHLPAINTMLNTTIHEEKKRPRASSGKIVLLTGGTTGTPKKAAHTPSLFSFLNPFLTLVNRLKLTRCQTAYIATPLFHGYGIAILFSCIAFGKKVVVSREFNAQKACSLIRDHHVDVVTVVPLMIHKMLDYHAEDLKSLVCIASGGAELSPKLVKTVSSRLGAVLYNLYGTSEAGLSTIATPQDLAYSPRTIGRKIDGVPLHVLDEAKRKIEAGTIGQFCLKNKWSMTNRAHAWMETGDVGWRDANGYYFLCGRIDDMVVSAGENVYPMDIELVLSRHPEVACTAVIGTRDERYGQRLTAFVQPAEEASLTKEALLDWLSPKIARFQMPKEIVFVQNMPYTALGKLDKKQLRELGS